MITIVALSLYSVQPLESCEIDAKLNKINIRRVEKNTGGAKH